MLKEFFVIIGFYTCLFVVIGIINEIAGLIPPEYPLLVLGIALFVSLVVSVYKKLHKPEQDRRQNQ